MGAQLLDLQFCCRCGFLFIRTAGRAKKGWTHHDGTRTARQEPSWCTCRAREPVLRKLHAAVLSAECIGGRAAAQSLLDQVRGVPAKRDPDRLQVSRKNYQLIESAYMGINRSVSHGASTFAQIYGAARKAMMIVDDPMIAEVPATDEQRAKILAWFEKVLPRTAGT